MNNTLKLFQCNFNRSIEENFAQVLTENEKVRLFFINENEAFTDGRNIIVDPAIGDIFADAKAIRLVEDFMRLQHLISGDPWYALRMITRAQNIHECLHILYSDFPLQVGTDARSSTSARGKTLALINNIIEDAFIEAAGCSVFDNLELYLCFFRMAMLFRSTPTSGTVDRVFQKENSEKTEPLPITEYLSYMATFLLYPMIRQKEPPEPIADYVERTKQLFLDGSICGEPGQRYTFSQRIFDIIEPIIPESAEGIDDSRLLTLLHGTKTHNGEANAITAIGSNGRTVVITRRLFVDIAGKSLPDRSFGDQLLIIADDYARDKKAALQIVLFQPVVVNWKGAQFDCHVMHKDIEIIETKPKPNLNLRKAYQNIYNKYHININSYNSRFTQLLKARIPGRDERKLFGAGISSRYLADTKKRYWYRNDEKFGLPDMAVMLLIDGSGSMDGPRRGSAIVSSVILHEVLKKQGITHAIVEHRAGGPAPTVDVNILVSFNARDEEKYNLMGIAAGGDNRDGLVLSWAERYFAVNTHNAQRLLIVLADGVPAHAYDKYYPPVSSKDTANTAIKIIRRGTDIIAVALDDSANGSYACYDALAGIYPAVVSCTDLKRLIGQLLGIVSKHLR